MPLPGLGSAGVTVGVGATGAALAGVVAVPVVALADGLVVALAAVRRALGAVRRSRRRCRAGGADRGGGAGRSFLAFLSFLAFFACSAFSRLVGLVLASWRRAPHLGRRHRDRAAAEVGGGGSAGTVGPGRSAPARCPSRSRTASGSPRARRPGARRVEGHRRRRAASVAGPGLPFPVDGRPGVAGASASVTWTAPGRADRLRRLDLRAARADVPQLTGGDHAEGGQRAGAEQREDSRRHAGRAPGVADGAHADSPVHRPRRCVIMGPAGRAPPHTAVTSDHYMCQIDAGRADGEFGPLSVTRTRPRVA